MSPLETRIAHPVYRPDIDGLRAIAVLSVVAFHAFPTLLEGGFIGVDVFFVISGYLISTIVFKNLERGTFSFRDFYARRINRLFPALILVLVASFVFGWFALLPDEYKQLGKHIAAGTGFVSNLILWREAGYFDSSAETKPLLHLWSLGIEEQFYVVWPLLLWSAWKRKFNLPAILVCLAGVSFLLNLQGVNDDAAATFYSPQTRLWELLCGGLLAWVTLCKESVSATFKARIPSLARLRVFREQQAPAFKTLPSLTSLAGLFLLAYGLSQITKEKSFPGTWAVVPVLGTVLIIAAGPAAMINRTILSSRVAVELGLISYPLYLWHWPLLSFARIIESQVPDRNIRIAAIALSVVLAWLTRQLVERPMQQAQLGAAKSAGLAAAMLATGLVGSATYVADGFPKRSSLSGIKSEPRGATDPISRSACLDRYGLSEQIRFCSISTVGNPRIALIGDSHADALYIGLSEVLARDGQGLLNIGGRLFLDVATYPSSDASEIDTYKGGIQATEFVAAEESIDTVIMVSRGPFYLLGNWVFRLISAPSVTDRNLVWEVGMRKTLDRFVGAKKKIIFVIDNPEIDFDPRLCLDRPLRPFWKMQSVCAVPRSQFDLRNKNYRRVVFKVLQDYPEVVIFDAAAYLCDKDWCQVKIDGEVLYKDTDHLSLAGSRRIAKELAKVMNGHESKVLSR